MHQIIQPQMFYFGFPVILLTTTNHQNHHNITPISSSWCLGKNIVIGLGTQGKAFENLNDCREMVLNLPDAKLQSQIERIAPFTGKNPIPEIQKEHYQFCENKFELGGFTPIPAVQVKPMRILECPIHAECQVKEITDRGSYAIVELEILMVHAEEELIFAENKINPEKWQPLIYNFRHYYSLGECLGKNFRA